MIVWFALVTTACRALQWPQQQHPSRLLGHWLTATATTTGEKFALDKQEEVPQSRAWFDACVAAVEASDVQRSTALEKAQLLGLSLLANTTPPSPRQEPWRFADLRAIWAATPCVHQSRERGTPADILYERWYAASPHEEQNAAVIILVDGVVAATRNCGGDGSSSASPPSFYVGAIGNAPSEVARRFDLSAIPEAALEAADPNSALGSTPFAALNAACMTDAVLIAAKGNVRASALVVHATTEGVAHARLAIAVDDTAQLELQQIFVMDDDDVKYGEEPKARLCNSRTTIDVAEGASLSHVYAVVEELHSAKDEYDFPTKKTNHLEATAASVAGRYTGTVLATSRSRVGVDLALTEPGASASLDALGLAAAKGDVVDLRTQIRHTCPDASSRQDVRLVAAKGGSLLFKGRIYVPTEAQHTDAEQLCRAAVLSDTASANVMPCLDIVADDVKCAHGATVADLDEDALFFLLARGIRQPLAKALLVRGFCDDLLVNLNLTPKLVDILDCKISLIADVEDSLDYGLSTASTVSHPPA